jgi:hypothetical protein
MSQSFDKAANATSEAANGAENQEPSARSTAGGGAPDAAVPGFSPEPRSGPRSRQEIRRERQALAERTQQEIDVLAAEFHALLPRARASAVGAIYARYSSRHQDSIAERP